MFAVVACCTASVLGGCARAPGEQLVVDSLAPVQTALQLMQDAHGDDKVLLEATLQWRANHGMEVRAVRERAERLLPTLSPDEKLRLETDARNQSQPLMAQIASESQKFRDPQLALRLIRPMLVPMQPQGIHGKPSWLPEVPPPPGLPEPPTP